MSLINAWANKDLYERQWEPYESHLNNTIDFFDLSSSKVNVGDGWTWIESTITIDSQGCPPHDWDSDGIADIIDNDIDNDGFLNPDDSCIFSNPVGNMEELESDAINMYRTEFKNLKWGGLNPDVQFPSTLHGIHNQIDGCNSYDIYTLNFPSNLNDFDCEKHEEVYNQYLQQQEVIPQRCHSAKFHLT